MEDENGVVDTLNQPEEEALETSSEETSTEETEDGIDYKTLYEKEKERAENQKIRAEKAEKAEKAAKAKPEVASKPSPTAGDLTSTDLYALMEAKVPQEDIEEVREYATLKKISVAEALKSSIVKSILSDKAEQRQSALAANVGPSKRSSGKIPDEMLLKNAAEGKLPDNDADLDRLIRARKGYKS
jgi:hypothetical protein